MADVLVDSKRRVLISGYGYGVPAPPPPPALDSQLLGRLEQMDLRLRQLEEQQQGGAPARRRAPAAAQHQHTKSLPAALQHVQVPGEFLDRLDLLEYRIRQVSCELDLMDYGGGGNKAVHQLGLGLGLGSSSSVPPFEDPATWPADSAPVPVVDPAYAGGGGVKSKPAAAVSGGSWNALEMLQRGARQLQRSKSNPPSSKVNNLKETKCVSQKEKRKQVDRGKTSRWRFMDMAGCKLSWK